MKKKTGIVALALALFMSVAAVAQQEEKKEPPKPKTTSSGLKYIDHVEGNGEEAKRGMTVEVNYAGWLYNGNKRGGLFDTSVGKKPFQFKLGAQQVIPGWDEGVAGMKVGGKRELIIPSSLAYRSQGVPGVIPPNSTLNFEVVLLRIVK